MLHGSAFLNNDIANDVNDPCRIIPVNLIKRLCDSCLIQQFLQRSKSSDLETIRFCRGLFRFCITIVQEIIIVWKHVFCFWITIYQFSNTYSFFNIELSILLIIARQNMIDIAAFSLLDNFRFGWFFDCYIQVAWHTPFSYVCN